MTFSDIVKYNEQHTGENGKVCELLTDEIGSVLPEASAKIFHGQPVWFLDGNPVVGYKVSGNGVELMFWSGQSFDEPQLQATGKHKAARTSFDSVGQVDVQSLRNWLKVSKTIQWDYKNLSRNKGELKRLA